MVWLELCTVRMLPIVTLGQEDLRVIRQSGQGGADRPVTSLRVCLGYIECASRAAVKLRPLSLGILALRIRGVRSDGAREKQKPGEKGSQDQHLGVAVGCALLWNWDF